MKILRIVLISFCVLSVVILFLYVQDTSAYKALGKWKCEKASKNQTFCIGIGQDAQKDVEQLTKTKASCKWVCTRTCFKNEETGKNECVEVCRGNGSQCDPVWDHFKPVKDPAVMPRR